MGLLVSARLIIGLRERGANKHMGARSLERLPRPGANCFLASAFWPTRPVRASERAAPLRSDLRNRQLENKGAFLAGPLGHFRGLARDGQASKMAAENSYNAIAGPS